MQFYRALRGYVVGAVLAAAVVWYGYQWIDAVRSVFVVPVAVAVFTACGQIGLHLARAENTNGACYPIGDVWPGGGGSPHVEHQQVVPYVSGGGVPLHEVARLIRASDADRAFEYFTRVKRDYYAYVLLVLIEDGYPEHAAPLLVQLAQKRSTEAADLIVSDPGPHLLAVLLLDMSAQDRYEVASTLEAQRLAAVLVDDDMPTAAAAYLLGDISARDAQLTRHALTAMGSDDAAFLLRHAPGGRPLAKVVAGLAWRTRHRIVPQLRGRNDALVAEIQRAVNLRWGRRLGVLATVAALLCAALISSDDNPQAESSTPDRTPPPSVQTAPTTPRSPVSPSPRSKAVFPAKPKLADYHPRWRNMCSVWRPDDTDRRLADICDFVAHGKPYQVVYKQYPLGEKPFVEGSPGGPTTGDWVGYGRKGRYQWYPHEMGWSVWLEEDDTTRVAMFIHSHVLAPADDSDDPPEAVKKVRVASLLRT